MDTEMLTEENSYDVFTLNFRIDDLSLVNETEFKLINRPFMGNRTTCEVLSVDGQPVLSYSIPATLPLNQFLKKQLYKPEFLSMLSNIMNQLIFFEENDIPLKKVLLNTKYMYIEISSLEVQLIYMPIEKNFADCNISEFVQSFISKVRFGDMQCVGCVDEILRYLDSRLMFSIRDFYNFLLELEKDTLSKDVEVGKEAETTVLAQMEYKNFVPVLVRMRTNSIVNVEKTEFIVGKASDCDFQIVDNKKISRHHMTLKISNGECYVIDNDSTNHTYINGNLLQPNFPVMLKNNDIIKMADEEFKYWVR